jgi:hypothetical protein
MGSNWTNRLNRNKTKTDTFRRGRKRLRFVCALCMFDSMEVEVPLHNRMEVKGNETQGVRRESRRLSEARFRLILLRSPLGFPVFRMSYCACMSSSLTPAGTMKTVRSSSSIVVRLPRQGSGVGTSAMPLPESSSRMQATFNSREYSCRGNSVQLGATRTLTIETTSAIQNSWDCDGVVGITGNVLTIHWFLVGAVQAQHGPNP